MNYLKSMIKKRVDLRYKYMNRERVVESNKNRKIKAC